MVIQPIRTVIDLVTLRYDTGGDSIGQIFNDLFSSLGEAALVASCGAFYGLRGC